MYIEVLLADAGVGEATEESIARWRWFAASNHRGNIWVMNYSTTTSKLTAGFLVEQSIVLDQEDLWLMNERCDMFASLRRARKLLLKRQ